MTKKINNTSLNDEHQFSDKKNFNAIMWIALGITLLLETIGIIIADTFGLNSDGLMIAVIIAGVGIWFILLWGYLPNLVNLWSYLEKRSFIFWGHSFPPINEDSDIIKNNKIYKKTNPLKNILIAIFIFIIALSVYLGVSAQ